MRRTVLVGDVHGCRDELVELLDRVGLGDDDRLVLVGDLVARLFDVEDLARGTGLQAPVQPFRPNARLEDERLVVQA